MPAGQAEAQLWPSALKGKDREWPHGPVLRGRGNRQTLGTGWALLLAKQQALGPVGSRVPREQGSHTAGPHALLWTWHACIYIPHRQLALKCHLLYYIYFTTIKNTSLKKLSHCYYLIFKSSSLPTSLDRVSFYNPDQLDLLCCPGWFQTRVILPLSSSKG